MRRILIAIMMSALMVGEAQAADWQSQGAEVQTGAFVGAKLKLSLGDRADAKPHAQLAIAPSRSSISNAGYIRTRIGEGGAFELRPGGKPELLIAGVRADQALGIGRSGSVDSKNKLGLSTGAWIGIGVIAAIGVGVLLFKDYCDRKISSICGDEE